MVINLFDAFFDVSLPCQYGTTVSSETLIFTKLLVMWAIMKWGIVSGKAIFPQLDIQ